MEIKKSRKALNLVGIKRSEMMGFAGGSSYDFFYIFKEYLSTVGADILFENMLNVSDLSCFRKSEE